MDEKGKRRIKRGILLFLLWLLATPVTLLLVVLLALQLPASRHFIAAKAVSFVSAKTNTVMRLDDLRISLAGNISVNGLYVEDQQHDTLFYMGRLYISADLFALASKRVLVRELELEDVTARIHSIQPDSLFNYSFIAQAFAGKPSPPSADTTASDWRIEVDHLLLSDIRFTYADARNGLALRGNSGACEIAMDALDLQAMKLVAREVSLAGAAVELRMTPSRVPPDTTGSSSPPDLLVKKLRVSRSVFHMKDASGMELLAKAGSLSVEASRTDIRTIDFDIDKIRMANSICSFTVGAADTTAVPAAAGDTSEARYHIVARRLELENNSFSFDDPASPPAPGFDYAHMHLSDIRLTAGNALASPDTMRAVVEQLAVRDRCGLDVKRISGRMVYDNRHAAIDDMSLETEGTHLKRYVMAGWTSLAALARTPDSLSFAADLDGVVDPADVLYFVPWMATDPTFAGLTKRPVHVRGSVRGGLGEFRVSGFTVRTGSTEFMADGTVRHVTDSVRRYLDLGEVHLSTGRAEVASLLGALVPTSVAVPDTLNLDASFRGYLTNFDADVTLQSSSGNVVGYVKMDPSAGPAPQSYAGRVNVSALDLGYLLKNPQLGPLTLHGTVQGRGFDSTMEATMNLVITSAMFNKYNYRNAIIKGTATRGSFSGDARMQDDNLAFDFRGSVDLREKEPRLDFTFNLAGADLHALHFTDEDMRVKLSAAAGIGSDPNHNISGDAAIRDIVVVRGGRKHYVDSVVLRSRYADGQTTMDLRSDFAEASAKGRFSMGSVGDALARQLNGYFDFGYKGTGTLTPQQVDFSVKLTDPSAIAGDLVPDLEKLSPFEIKGSFSSAEKKITLDADIPQAKYGGTLLDSLKLRLNGDVQKLTYQAGLGELSNPTFKTENALLSGSVAANRLEFGFTTARDDSTTLLATGGAVTSDAGKYALSLRPHLTLNAAQWNVDSLNSLVFGGALPIANRFTLSNGPQTVSLQSEGSDAGSPLGLQFRDFELATLSRLVENQGDLLKGRVNGTATLGRHGGGSAIRSDLVITDLVFHAVPLGTLKVKADNYDDPDRYDVNVDLEGYGSKLALGGNYGVKGGASPLNLSLDVTKLNLVSVQPFVQSQATRLSGTLSGKLRIRGTTASPDLDGVMHLDETTVAPKMLDSYLSIPSGDITFKGQKVLFSNFTVIDTLSNKAMLSGSVDLSKPSDPALDLRLKTGNFLAMNTTKNDNPVYFGRVFVDSDVKIRGRASLPLIDANARLNKGSALTYIKPRDQAVKNEAKGIVEFTDSLGTASTIMTRRDTAVEVKGMEGVELHAAINVDRSVRLVLVIDPAAGDSLYLRGGGLLNLTLDRSGSTGLSGKYTIDDGGYYLTVSDFVKRSFKIERGSSVTWSGDPLDAYVDLRAVYTVKTSPIDLVESQMSGMSDLERNKYRNALTFLVYLNMNGFVSQPQISFDIQLAPDDRGAMGGAVNARLEQLKGDETQLNKQVFALLTLKRFVGENPLESSGDGGFSSASRSSASRVLTQQLNTLSDRYVNFVDLDVGVNSFEDYSSGKEQGRTQLQLGVSKQLFNDKVTVRVGGNIELEGERAQQNNANDMAGNITIEYKLTDDGRYKLKAYRQNQYENPIEGEITKSATGVVLMRNFNRFSDLFKKPRHRRQTPAPDNVP